MKPQTEAPGVKRPRDAFIEALRDDAGRIRVEIAPDLERRIDAALARERPVRAAAGRRDPLIRPWLAGSLAGLAVAALIMLLIGRLDAPLPPTVATPDSAIAQATPEYIRMLKAQVPLRVETADLTAPLEQELRDLESDIDKARENLERELRLTF